MGRCIFFVVVACASQNIIKRLRLQEKDCGPGVACAFLPAPSDAVLTELHPQVQRDIKQYGRIRGSQKLVLDFNFSYRMHAQVDMNEVRLPDLLEDTGVHAGAFSGQLNSCVYQSGVKQCANDFAATQRRHSLLAVLLHRNKPLQAQP